MTLTASDDFLDVNRYIKQFIKIDWPFLWNVILLDPFFFCLFLKKFNENRQVWSDVQTSSATLVPSPSLDSIPNGAPSINNRKPVRIVKAIQRFPSSNNETSPTTGTTNRPLSASRTYSLAKPGLFSASPINSTQKTTQKALNSNRRFQSRDENDLELNLKEFAARYPNHNSFNELARTTLTDEHRLSTDYTRPLFPIPDHLRRLRSRQSSAAESNLTVKTITTPFESFSRTVSNDGTPFDDQSRRQIVRTSRKFLRRTKKENRCFSLSGRFHWTFETPFEHAQRESTYCKRRNRRKPNAWLKSSSIEEKRMKRLNVQSKCFFLLNFSY